MKENKEKKHLHGSREIAKEMKDLGKWRDRIKDRTQRFCIIF